MGDRRVAGALVLESLVGAVFLAVAVSGFRSSLWLVVLALAAHGIFDLGHGALISNPGVPRWWPEFCLTYDVTAAAYLAWRLKGRSGSQDRRLFGRARPPGAEVLAAVVGHHDGVFVSDIQLARGIRRAPARSETEA
jgi:hypothetical protein